MGIFKVEKKDLDGNTVESYEMQNTILDAGLEYLCTAVGYDFDSIPQIGVGSSDITPDTNQVGLISPVAVTTATFTPGTSTDSNPEGDKQFIVSANFTASQAIGELTELTYYMNTLSGKNIPLNRTLFQVPGQLDTAFTPTPELDQIQNIDVSNVTQVYGANFYDQTFTVSASGGPSGVNNIVEIALSMASSGDPAYPLTVALYSDSSGSPGTLLSTATIPAFANPVQEWVVASFGSPVAVTAGLVYHIVVSCPLTDQADCYDLFGSVADEYPYGQLSVSTNSGLTYSPVNPSQDFGFKTYYSTSGAAAHEYVATLVQFNKETGPSSTYTVNSFPINNLDSISLNEGTVRLTLPTYEELNEFTSKINIYKNVGGVFGLLASVGTVREYFYDNGSITPNTSINPPSASSITTPSGLTAIVDSTNGGSLELGQNKYYKVSAIQQGPLTTSITVGPYQRPGVTAPPDTEFYDVAYTTTPVPLYGAEYETEASGEYALTAPTSASAQFAEYFTESSLSPALWNITNNNSDYFNLVTLNSTGESQLQMNVPAGVPYVVSSTRKARPGQSYYINVQIPLSYASIPQYVYSSNGTRSINPILNDTAPNRVSLFSFVNPENIQTQSADKRLSFEFGLYHDYRLDDQYTTGNSSQYAQGPYFALYDNVGNVYLFSTSDIQQSHTDKCYTFKIDVLDNRSMQISYLNATTRTFEVLTSSITYFNFATQENGNHTHPGGALPGPLVQTTDHFLIPENYCFAIGNPSNDPLAYSNVNYIACNDSIYTIPGTSPTVPVPAIAMTLNGTISPTGGGFGATLTWNAVPGARKYHLYATGTAGSYNAANGNLVYEYETYFPAYAVQSTDTPNNDFFNDLVAVGSQVRNWQNIGVTFGVDATTTGTFNGYALGGFVGSNSENYGNPILPSIASAPGTAETYLLLLTGESNQAIFTFMGGGFSIVAETSPYRGIGALYIDGNFVENIDFYSADTYEQQTVFTTSALAPGYHTATIKPTGTSNDFSLGTSIALDYFYITVPAIVDPNTLTIGAPLSANNSNIGPVPAPNIAGSQTYNGNGPTVVVKDPQHTLTVEMVFSLVNPNIS